MKYKINWWISAVMMVGFVIVLCGCSTKLKTESQAVHYAEMRYGSCTAVSTQKNSDDKVVYKMKDNDYWFEYEVISEISEINIDGSSFGKYEYTSDTFIECFRDYIFEDAKDQFESIENQYNAKIETGDILSGSLVTIRMNNGNVSNAEKASKQAASVFKHYEKKKLFSSLDIYVYSNEDELIGKCRIESGTWMDTTDIKDEQIIMWAKSKKGNANLIRKETKTFADTGLSKNQVAKFHYNSDINYPQESDDPVEYYYFEASGKEFFVCNFYSTDTDNWYTNYYEVFKKRR